MRFVERREKKNTVKEDEDRIELKWEIAATERTDTLFQQDIYLCVPHFFYPFSTTNLLDFNHDFFSNKFFDCISHIS